MLCVVTLDRMAVIIGHDDTGSHANRNWKGFGALTPKPLQRPGAARFVVADDEYEEPRRERIRQGPSGISMPWFLPYFDLNQTAGETQQHRLAYRRMLADPNVAAAWKRQVFSAMAAAAQLTIAPATKTNPRDKEIADFVLWNLRDRLHEGMMGLAWDLLSGGTIDGHSICERVHDVQTEGRWASKTVLHRFKAKDVGHDCVLEVDEFKNVIGVRALRYNTGEIWPVKDFVIFTHQGLFENPGGMSVFRSAYSRYFMLDTVMKLRGMGAEKRAMPVVVGEYPDETKRVSTETSLARIKFQNWLAVPKDVKVTALDIAGSSEQYFNSFCQQLREEIVLAICGAVGQSMHGGPGVERGDSKVHKDTADVWVWVLIAALEHVLNDHEVGVIPDLVRRNYAGVYEYPRATLGGVDDSELGESLKLDQGLAQLGADLSLEDIHERFNRKRSTGPNDKLTPPGQGQPPPGGGPGGPGGPGGAPGGAGGGPAALPFASSPSTGLVAFADAPPPDDWAPRGADGKAAGHLLQHTFVASRNALTTLAHDAAQRWLRSGGQGDLLRENERDELADTLAAVLAQGDLVGRSRLRLRAQQRPTTANVTRFAEWDESKHERNHGQFAKTAGSGAESSEENQGAFDEHEHLPDHARATLKALNQGLRLDVTAKESREHYRDSSPLAMLPPEPQVPDKREDYVAYYNASDAWRPAAAMALAEKAKEWGERLVALPRSQAESLRALAKVAGESLAGIGADKASVKEAGKILEKAAAKTEKLGSKLAALGGKVLELAKAYAEFAMPLKPQDEETLPEEPDRTDREAYAQWKADADAWDVANEAYEKAGEQRDKALGKVHGALEKFEEVEDDVLSVESAAHDELAGTLGDAAENLNFQHEPEEDEDEGEEDEPPTTPHSERPTNFTCFADDPVTPRGPDAAIHYFRKLVPTLGIDPQRHGDDLRRRAFTLAVATEQTLLEQVQELLAGHLEQTDGVLPAAAEVEALLDRAGITPTRPNYGELVVRTNLVDALNQGAWDEFNSPDLDDLFPAWKYSNPDDGRSRRRHAALNGRIFPRHVPFNEVRGTHISDCANCRCSWQALHHSDLAEELARGAVLETSANAVAKYAEDWREWPEGVNLAEVFAEEDWSRQRAPRGKSDRRWVNAKTGEVKYADENPGKVKAKSESAADAGEKKPKAETEPKADAKTAPKGGKVKPPTVDEAHAQLTAMVGQTITAERLGEVVSLALSLSKKDLTALRDKLGVKASGTKAEMAAKITSAALGDGKAEPKIESKPKDENAETTVGITPQKEDAVADAMLRAYREIDGNSTSGIITIPDLHDRVKAAHPDLTRGQFHGLLRKWANEDKINLQLSDALYLNPRRDEGMSVQEGDPAWNPKTAHSGLMYVQLAGKDWEHRESKVEAKSEPESKPKAEPKTEPVGESSWSDHPAATSLSDSLSRSVGLSQGQREQYGKAMGQALAAMPKQAHDRIAANLKNAMFHPNVKSLGMSAVNAILNDPQTPADELEQVRGLLEAIDGGQAKLGGAYLPRLGTLHVDGNDAMTAEDKKGHGGRYGYKDGTNMTAHEIYAHELGHVIDGPTFSVSDSPEWQAAWQAEIRRIPMSLAQAKLTAYGGTIPAEGLAEFSRLLYGSDVPLAQIKKDFPRASAVFEKQSLWPVRQGGTAGKMSEVFDKRIDLDKQGGHADTLLEPKTGEAGFTGTDAQGRKRENGELVAKAPAAKAEKPGKAEKPTPDIVHAHLEGMAGKDHDPDAIKWAGEMLTSLTLPQMKEVGQRLGATKLTGAKAVVRDKILAAFQASKPAAPETPKATAAAPAAKPDADQSHSGIASRIDAALEKGDVEEARKLSKQLKEMPAPAPAEKKPAEPRAPKEAEKPYHHATESPHVQSAVNQMKQVYEDSILAGVGAKEIDEGTARALAGLSHADLIRVARGMGIMRGLPSKKEALAAIAKLPKDRAHSFHRAGL